VWTGHASNTSAGAARIGGSDQASALRGATAIAPDSDDRSVLSVYAVWHPGCEQAEELAHALFRALCANPEVPASRGLGIPVRFRTSASPDEVPAPVPLKAAQQNAVFVLADDLLVADQRWRSFADELAQQTAEGDILVPVALTRTRNLPTGLGQLQVVRLEDVPTIDQPTILLNRVMHDLCRLLDPKAAKVKVFLSHAKHDGLEITTNVLRYLRELAGLDEFFDATDIPDGTRFAEFIKTTAGSVPALLAVQTDSYASREWCRLEVLEAKRRRVPIVVLAAVENRESRSFPYMGNVPVVRWRGAPALPMVVSALLGEVLRNRYFPLRVRAIGRHHPLGDPHQVLAYPPELLTVLAYRADLRDKGQRLGRYIYPDPPLGSEEMEFLRELDPDVEPITPTLLQAI
jgi:hypothetical protein